MLRQPRLRQDMVQATLTLRQIICRSVNRLLRKQTIQPASLWEAGFLIQILPAMGQIVRRSIACESGRGSLSGCHAK